MMFVACPVSEAAAIERKSKHTEKALRFFRAAGLFAEVGSDVRDPDLEIVLHVVEEEDFSTALTVVSTLTLFMIPVVDDKTVTVTGSILDAHGTTLAPLAAKGEFRVMIQLFLFPAIGSVGAAAEATDDDLYKSIVVQTREHRQLWKCS